jgi:hypothetical protein
MIFEQNKISNSISYLWNITQLTPTIYICEK